MNYILSATSTADGNAAAHRAADIADVISQIEKLL